MSDRTGWAVCLVEPGCKVDRTICFGLSQREARAEARRRNRELLRTEGVPQQTPFAFYYARHSNHDIQLQLETDQ